jgi:hypothetical protein
MPLVTSFGYSSDPGNPAATDISSCTLDHANQRASWVGATNVPFSAIGRAVAEIRAKANQVVTDKQVDTEGKVYADDGSTVVLTVKAAGTPSAGVQTVSPGAADLPPIKALDLANGLEQYVPGAAP